MPDLREAKIRSLTVGTETRKHIHLRGAQLFRKLKANDWTRIRIALSGVFRNDLQRYPRSGIRYGIGLNSGSAAGVGNATCTHALMAGWMATTGDGWEDYRLQRLVTGGDYYIWPNGGSGYVASFVGSTAQQVATSSAGLGAWYMMGPVADSGTNYYRCVAGFSITKGSPNWTISDWCHPGTSAPAAYAENTAENVRLHQDSLVVGTEVKNHSPSSWTPAKTIAVDEATNGVLDHLHVIWDATNPSLYIDQLIVTRLQ